MPNGQWSKGAHLKFVGPNQGQLWAKMQNAHIKWASVQAKCLILLVAREGFEPPTFGL